jgi:hypothetical protein
MVRPLFIAALMTATALPLAAQSFSFNTGDASLDVTLSSINVQASGDIGPYTADLSVSFGVPQPQIRTWITVERMQPAEVYLALELGRISHRPPATVIAIYRRNHGRGWGVVARELGIRPGSAEFRELKGSAADKDRKIKGRKHR